jgi:hypothetical protein
LVKLLVGKINELVMLDINASTLLNGQLNQVYLENTAYLAQSLAQTMVLSANLLSQVHVIILDSVTNSNGLLGDDVVKVNQLKVDKIYVLHIFINRLKQSW